MWITKLAHWFRPSGSDAGQEPGQAAGGAQPQAAHWSWLIDAIRARLSLELSDGIARRREIAPDDVYEVAHIELRPAAHRRPEFEALLRDFSQDQLRQWICGRCGDLALVSQGLAFTPGLSIGIGEGPAKPPGAGIDLDAILAGQDPAGEVGVVLAGAFKPFSAIVQGAGDLHALIHVEDANGVRQIQFLGSEMVLGRGTQPAIEGEFVSARHLRLTWDGASVWLGDAGSVNGTYAAAGALARQPIRLDDKLELRLGCELASRAHDAGACPRLIVSPVVTRGLGAGRTPVRVQQPEAAATPLRTAPAASPQDALLTLAVHESATKHSIVPVSRLPFTIGRSSANDLVIADANQAVSRRHCALVSVDAEARVVRVRVERAPTHGTYLDDAKQHAPEFDWPLDKALWLGGTAHDQQFQPVKVIAQLGPKAT